MKKIILAKSSSGDFPYEVEIELAGGKISIICGCQAGDLGIMCKHKAAIIVGQESILYDSKQSKDFLKVQKWIKDTKLSEEYDKYLSSIDQIEQAKKEAIEPLKQELKKVRAIFARRLMEGM